MKIINIVTRDNIGNTIKLGRLSLGKLDVNIDNETIVVNANGELSVKENLNYLMYQSVGEQQTWIIEHNFGERPIVQVYNLDNKQVLVSPTHVSENVVQIIFNKPRAGYALIIV